MEGMKVVQMITMGVTSVPGGTISGAQFECQKFLAGQ